ncbi:MAG: hydroxymethylbilane synthase [Planctomycetes bacterium]|nr:hydroxymethylbilane synthase [Planctomycetota bacterium]
MTRTTIKLATRGSPLALTQTNQVIAKLQGHHPSLKFVPVVIRTTGDRITGAVQLRNAGTGVFVKELERALLKGQVDGAVHSLKDMPSALPEGLVLGAVLQREEAADAFVGRGFVPIERLAPGSVIGTSSPRRRALLLATYRNIRVEELRGNLDTRLAKLRAPKSRLAGIVVAAAGIRRLHGAGGVSYQTLPKETIVPAVGQGALCLEIRAEDKTMREIVGPLHHPTTASATEAERELLRRLEGGCQVPLGIHGEIGEDGLLRLIAALGFPDGTQLIRAEATGAADSPRELAEMLETLLRARGADEILTELRPASVPTSRNGHRRLRRAKAKAHR